MTPHLETIREILRMHIEKKYRSYHNAIYRFYQFYETQTGSMEDAVKEILKNLTTLSRQKRKKPPPTYIEAFFSNMENLLEEDEENENEYNTPAKFEKRLDAKLNKMLDKVFYLWQAESPGFENKKKRKKSSL
jgi:hypothetical protein